MSDPTDRQREIMPDLTPEEQLTLANIRRLSPLTERQRQILALLWREQMARRPVPTIREIGAALGLRSYSAVWRHVVLMHFYGWVYWPPGLGRAIRITEAGHLALGRRWKFPVLGTVS